MRDNTATEPILQNSKSSPPSLGVFTMSVAPLRHTALESRTEQLPPATEHLLQQAGPALAGEHEPQSTIDRYPDLISLLQRRNGFLVYGSTIEVFPLSRAAAGPDQISWNHPNFWRAQYPELDQARAHVFGQDAFARQYAIDSVGRVHVLDLETSELELYGATLDEWAWRIDRERRECPYGRLAGEWVRVNGALRGGERLAARIPFALGGERTVENVEALDVYEALSRARDTNARLERRSG